MDEIKAVVFDWGGVLIDDPAADLTRFCSKALSVPTEQFAETHGKHIPEFQKGLISEREFWKNICNDLDIAAPRGYSLWGEAFHHVYSPKEEMFHLATSLKSFSALAPVRARVGAAHGAATTCNTTWRLISKRRFLAAKKRSKSTAWIRARSARGLARSRAQRPYAVTSATAPARCDACNSLSWAHLSM